ncbi:DNA-binding transcriptional LysR family regulator [Actinoplanes tereljensis]|uniref:LysR-family transcriptional regulator n=1 Tax=Paractinoplanes tereljensis TaxID=571912 RepID=A0A919NY13_9ACTN|nr:LysR family transcriptional regulator [Actinoplanes tereljensis]GIF25934.1 putative LysR-family transcriptional regulator [Actinoplanes tereljensis]
MPLPPWISDLPALDLLLSVAETGSVGRAAQRHGISQPAASERLAKLERRLGVPLLVRSRRGSLLTPAGQAVVVWSQQVIEAAHTLADGVRTLRDDQKARLRVAASLTVAEYMLPAWLLALRRTHPDLEISAQVANSQGVCEAVRGGAADLGFVESPDIPAGLSSRQVGEDRVALVVSASYPLAARASLKIADLPDQPLLLREPGSGTRNTFLNALGDVDLPHATSLGSTTTILATVRAGGGIGVVSARATDALVRAGELVEVRVRGLSLVRPLHAVWLGAAPTDLAAELIANSIAA